MPTWAERLGDFMTIQELENSLKDIDYAIKELRLRKEGFITLETENAARDFFIKFLTCETTVGIPYKDYELLNAYNKIKKLVNRKSEIFSTELPYHPLQSQPKHRLRYTLDKCSIYIGYD